jgi:hypothetical protein
MIQNLHESPYAKKSKIALHSVPSTKENSKQKNDEQTLIDCIPSVIDEMRKIGVLENWISFFPVEKLISNPPKLFNFIRISHRRRIFFRQTFTHIHEKKEGYII